MKLKLALFLLLIFVVKIKAQSAGQICRDTKLKSFRHLSKINKVNYPGDETIDALYYKIDLFIDKDSINGSTTVKITPASSSINSFFLDLKSNLTVDSVLHNNARIDFIRNPNEDKLHINLPDIISPLEAFEIVVYYNGYPESNDFGNYVYGDSPSITGRSDNQPVIWTLTEPFGASSWFPCKDTPGDKVDSSDVWITSDKFYKTVSNGKLEEIIDNGSTYTYKWKNRTPIAQYLISIAMTNYEEYNIDFEYEPGKIMNVINYVYPGTLTSSLKNEIYQTIPMLQFFSEIFGQYPFINDKYGHAQIGGGNMENQTISSVYGFDDLVKVHELAHQWFGDKITCKDWQNIWLNEGFATYSEALWYEHKEGTARYESYISNILEHAKKYAGSIYVKNPTIDEIFSGRSYIKGAAVLHMLRGVLGDEKFFAAVKVYATDPDLSYGVATTEDFRRVVEAVSNEDLDYFFSEWIYGENYPKYNYTWNYTEADGVYNVYINLNQTQNTTPSFFTMPIQFSARTNAGDTLFTVFNDQQSQTFNITLNSKPTNILLDPNNWILKTASGTTDITNKYELPNDFYIEQNYPNPFNPSTKFHYVMQRRENVKITVYDVLGKEVAVLVNEEKNPGVYEANFDLTSINKDLSSGIYVYQMKTDTFTDSKKMVLLK